MPQSQPRKVQVENTPSARPRDAAIRQAAKDSRAYLSDSTRKTTRDLSHSTTDEQFSYSYQQQGLQPSVGSVTPYRNVQTNVTYNQNTPPPTQQLESRPPGQNQPNNTVAKAAGKVTRSISPPTKSRGTSLNPKKAILKKLPGGLGEGQLGAIVDKAFVTDATIMIVPTAGTVWFSLQLPLAIVSLVFMGISSALAAAEETIKGNAITGTLWRIGEAIVSTINDASIALFGFDFNSLSPTTFFILTDGVVMLIGWFTLLIIGFVYLIFGISPILGKGSGAKISALIAALVFYALPVFNLFPWFGLWVIAVWFYPTDE